MIDGCFGRNLYSKYDSFRLRILRSQNQSREVKKRSWASQGEVSEFNEGRVVPIVFLNERIEKQLDAANQLIGGELHGAGVALVTELFLDDLPGVMIASLANGTNLERQIWELLVDLSVKETDYVHYNDIGGDGHPCAILFYRHHVEASFVQAHWDAFPGIKSVHEALQQDIRVAMHLKLKYKVHT